MKYNNKKRFIIFVGDKMKGKRRDFLLLTVFLLSGFLFNLNCTVTAVRTMEQDNWQSTVISGLIAESTYQNYKVLLKPDKFHLVGKLLTLFLVEKEKGYRIEELEDNKVFAIESRTTIQPGSKIYIETMDEERFHFSGELLLKKIIKFSCDFNVEIEYEQLDNEVRYQARILYNVPVVIEGINSLVTGLIGKDFVSDKIVDFIDNLHFVLEILNQLDSAAWNELVGDQELLETLVFPVSFTSEEINLVLDMISDND